MSTISTLSALISSGAIIGLLFISGLDYLRPKRKKSEDWDAK